MSLFANINTRAEYFDTYISFDDEFKFAVRILDESDKEVNMIVFKTKEEALEYSLNYKSN